MEISLSVYKFSVNIKRKNQLINFTQSIGGITLFESVGRFLSQESFYASQETGSADQEVINNKSITFKEWHSGDSNSSTHFNTVKLNERDYYQYLYLTVEGGETGQAADVRERQDDNSVDTLFSITPDQILARSHQVFIGMPCDTRVYAGIMIFTNYGRHGIKTLFTDIFRKAIRNSLISIGEVTVKVSPISNLDEVKRLLDERDITKLRLIKSYDEDGRLYRKAEHIFYEPSRVRFIDAIKRMFEIRNIPHTGIAEFDSFEPTDVSVTIKIDENKEKIIGIKNLDTVSFVEYISNHHLLQTDDKGIPTTESIEAIAKEVFEQYVTHLNRIDDGNNEEFDDE